MGLRPRDDSDKVGINPLLKQYSSILLHFFPEGLAFDLLLFALLLRSFSIPFGLSRFVGFSDDEPRGLLNMKEGALRYGEAPSN